MDPAAEQFQAFWLAAGDYSVKAVMALIIWFVGTTIAKVASDGVRRIIAMQDGIDISVANFAARAVRWLGLAIIAIFCLNLFGINTTSVAAMLGAMTLAIGLALRDTLANVAAGLMILIVRPFATGHFIEIGDHTGSVRSINLFHTELASVDNIQIIVPNSEIWKASIRNFSAYDRRRLDMVIGIDYGSDVDRAIRLIQHLIDLDPRALRDPQPFVRVTELAQSSVNITLRVWCRTTDHFDLKFDLTKQIKERFDQAGISIPYPHLEIIQKQPADKREAAAKIAGSTQTRHHL